MSLTILPGVKADPIQYRYSYEWLFRLMAEEGVHHLQLGTFFEFYQLPDEWFTERRAQAASHGITISSVFTAHRELGGFFRNDARWETIARKNFERLITAGALLGAERVGSNPGATLRDQMAAKPAGIACYLKHMKELMSFAKKAGVNMLTIEPMSCLAEPPTLPEEIAAMAQELQARNRATPGTAAIGYCADVSHGYADADGQVIVSPMQQLEATLPWLAELHLKNTDARFESTFGFMPAERARGIIDLAAVRDFLTDHAAAIPKKELVAYLEIGGPKLGRDYSDGQLETMLRESLRHVRATFDAQPVKAVS